MTGKGLGAPESIAPSEDGQDAPATIRARTRAGVVQEIDVGIKQFGFPSLSEAVRAIMLVFVRSPRVQDAVRRDLPLGVLEPSKER